MTRKNKISTLLYSIGIIIALMFLPWAAELTRADQQIQLIEFQFSFGSKSESKPKLDLLGYDALHVDEQGKRSYTGVWIGLAVVAVVAVVVLDSGGGSGDSKPNCHFVIIGGKSTRICD